MAVLPIRFFGEVKSELKKVTFPTRAEVIRLTVIIISVSLAVSLFLAGLDLIFSKAIELLLRTKP